MIKYNVILLSPSIDSRSPLFVHLPDELCCYSASSPHLRKLRNRFRFLFSAVHPILMSVESKCLKLQLFSGKPLPDSINTLLTNEIR
ncbi:hypothetical protein L1987_11641 [Smallanthus sonchifolius]|uniref:Uncharacterized protein n=1 Tax=Smallanthus sonchifolius TaxID=185202 RepID=A0ACB9JEZ2_9ASTR|nr:hypothetical protein L1987_11641 [Smallanthus sonchifolius]